MLNIKQIGIIAAQSTMAAAAGVAIVGYQTIPGFSPLATGSLAALIFGGNLAVHYTVGAIGEARGIAEWKVRLLQASAVALYDIALITTCVALGVMASTTALATSFYCLVCFSMVPVSLAMYQRKANPERIYKDALPPAIFSLPPRRSLERTPDEYREFYMREIYPQIILICVVSEPYRSELIERLQSRFPYLSREQHIQPYITNVEAILAAAPEMNQRHLPEVNLKLGRCLIHHMREAKALLMNPASPGLKHFTQEEIETVEGDSFWAITIMGLYAMISTGIYEPEKDLFTVKGAGEENLILSPDQDVLELRYRMIELYKSTQNLSDQAKTLLTLKLTRAGDAIENAEAKKISDPKQLEQMQHTFNALSALKGEIDRHLMNTNNQAPELALDWSQVFS